MSCSNIFENFIKYQDSIQSFIMFIGIIFAGWQTWKLDKLSKEESKKNFLNNKLFELQRLAFYDPYLEDETFTKRWDEMKAKYLNNELNDDELNKFIKYDIYTEMLFNFVFESLEVYKTREKLENFVEFKSWLNIHKYCWRSPLETNSNKDVYKDKMFNIVNSWINW